MILKSAVPPCPQAPTSREKLVLLNDLRVTRWDLVSLSTWNTSATYSGPTIHAGSESGAGSVRVLDVVDVSALDSTDVVGSAVVDEQPDIEPRQIVSRMTAVGFMGDSTLDHRVLVPEDPTMSRRAYFDVRSVHRPGTETDDRIRWRVGPGCR